MNLFIFGAGQIGQAAAYYAKKLGYDTVVLDTNWDNLQKIEGGTRVILEQNWQDDFEQEVMTYGNSVEVDGVLSCLPYFLNEKLSKECILRKIPYFDLGGVNAVTEAIDKLNEGKKSLVMQNLGLSPGLSEILCEKVYDEFEELPENVEIFVGGIPETALDEISYKLTWSTDGLLNNYEDVCQILQDRKIHTISARSKYCTLGLFGQFFEAFVTSGGAPNSLSLMCQRGIKNSCYRTIRWPGHISKLVTLDSSKRKQTLEESSKLHKNIKDIVLIHIRVSSLSKELTRTYKIRASDKYNAMQISTAVGALSAIDATLRYGKEGHLDMAQIFRHQNPIEWVSKNDVFWENLEKLELFNG